MKKQQLFDLHQSYISQVLNKIICMHSKHIAHVQNIFVQADKVDHRHKYSRVPNKRRVQIKVYVGNFLEN